MSNRVQTHSFTTSSIAAGSSDTFNRNLGPNWVNILKVKITPSTSTSLLRAEFYTKNTFAAADRAGGYSVSVNGPVIDPMEDVGAGAVDRDQLGFIMPLDDEDGTGQLHMKIYNDHTSAQTYDVVITWEPRFFLSPGASLTMSPGNSGHDIQILTVVDDTTTQRLEAAYNGTLVGSARKRFNFIPGNRMAISAADTGARIDLTFTASNQAQALEALLWSTNYVF